MANEQDIGFDIDLLPELPSALGIPASEAATGQACAETGVLVALLVFTVSDA